MAADSERTFKSSLSPRSKLPNQACHIHWPGTSFDPVIDQSSNWQLDTSVLTLSFHCSIHHHGRLVWLAGLTHGKHRLVLHEPRFHCTVEISNPGPYQAVFFSTIFRIKWSDRRLTPSRACHLGYARSEFIEGWLRSLFTYLLRT